MGEIDKRIRGIPILINIEKCIKLLSHYIPGQIPSGHCIPEANIVVYVNYTSIITVTKRAVRLEALFPTIPSLISNLTINIFKSSHKHAHIQFTPIS